MDSTRAYKMKANTTKMVNMTNNTLIGHLEPSSMGAIRKGASERLKVLSVAKKKKIKERNKATEGQSESNAFGDVVRPRLRKAAVVETGTIRHEIGAGSPRIHSWEDVTN